MAAVGGFGAKLKVEVAAVLTEVPSVVEMGFPSIKVIMADTTGHDAAGGYQTRLPSGRIDTDLFTTKVIWDPANAVHAVIRTANQAKAGLGATIENSDGTETSAQFTAYPTVIKRVSPQDGSYDTEIEWAPSGSVSYS